MAGQKVNQRAYVQLTSNDVPSLQKAFNQVFDNINQLQSAAAASKLFQAAANDNLPLIVDPATIPGTVLRLQAGNYLIIGVFSWLISSPNEVRGYLAVEGVKRTLPYASSFNTGGGAQGGTDSQVWGYSSISQGTVSLQSAKVNGSACQVNKDNTLLIAVKL